MGGTATAAEVSQGLDRQPRVANHVPQCVYTHSGQPCAQTKERALQCAVCTCSVANHVLHCVYTHSGQPCSPQCGVKRSCAEANQTKQCAECSVQCVLLSDCVSESKAASCIVTAILYGPRMLCFFSLNYFRSVMA